MKLLLICVFVAVASCSTIRTRTCLTAKEKETALKITSVGLEPCNGNPCILKRGGKTTLRIKFQAVQAEDDLEDVCHGRVGFWVPFPLGGKTHTCLAEKLCPLKPGKDYDYTYGIEISSSYPPIHVPVRWELKRRDGTRAFCEEFPTQLK